MSMKPYFYNAQKGLCLLLTTLQLSSCAFAPWEKSAIKGDTPEAKVASAQTKLDAKPDAALPRKDLLVTKELAVTQLSTQAQQAASKGQLQEAEGFYDRILSFLPDDVTAAKGKAQIAQKKSQDKKLEQATALVTDNKLVPAKEVVREVLMENPQQPKAIELQSQIDQQLSPEKATLPVLKPPFDKPVTLELRDANIKVVFEALSRATGINFILDKDIKPDTKATIFIKKARIDEAIDLVLSSNGLQKKALSENTALVFPSTPQKFKDYKDLVIRSFYLTNTSAKQVSALLKTMLKTKDIFVDDRLNMLVMRDTPEVIRIAEKLIAANDLEDPEVMLDIEVLEVSRSRLQELGIEFPNRIAVNSIIPLQTATSGIGGVVAQSTTFTERPLTLEGLLGLNKGRFDVSPNPAVNFRKVNGDVNLLSHPRIRVKNNEKAKVLVGDKVPIITTTSTANVGISENVQYVDVGLKLDVEPRITLDDFVNIKIGLEVSSLGERTVTRNGATVFTIGTRNANTILRLKNGETQILAGLILDDERKNASKVPGIGDIPLLGRLFANQEDRKSKTEIVLAITPRIIGNISRPQAEITEYWSGTETLINDKPQITVPALNTLSPQDRMREQMRLRQLQLNENQESASQAAEAQAPEQQSQEQQSPEPQIPVPQAAEPAGVETPASVSPIPNTIDNNANPVFGGSVSTPPPAPPPVTP